ncbi:hypothetical protein B0H34DRAFT_497167 [Crassisporium funariophilum]|nr:hypothetical protein B0H34DRAFT_497167 [Crassisporium funariophilum]
MMVFVFLALNQLIQSDKSYITQVRPALTGAAINKTAPRLVPFDPPVRSGYDDRRPVWREFNTSSNSSRYVSPLVESSSNQVLRGAALAPSFEGDYSI